MARLTKIKFLGVVFASLVLAACAGQDTTDEDARAAEREADAAAAAQAEAYASEQLSGGEVMEEDDKPVKMENKTVYFDFDESRLRPDTRRALDKAIDYLKKDSNKKLRLEGHCDERGTREYNLALGERRAKAVADYLALNGINRNRMELVSYGEEKPVALGSNEEAWAKNRRVELIVK